VRKIFLALVLAAAAQPAEAWTRAGHMVTAAIAYDDLKAHDQAVIDRIVTLIQTHPDHGSFEVAIARMDGDEKARRIFLEMARWSDDIRGGQYDHPTWHYFFRPVASADFKGTLPGPTGEAPEAFALNFKEAADENAPAGDRAVALCWIFHIVGDIHQPLHTAQRFSQRFPQGDKGGSLEFVREPGTGAPEALHWFWDDSVNKSDDPDVTAARARDLEGRYPRATLGVLEASNDWPAEFRRWANDESYPLAVSLAYRKGVQFGTSPDAATALPAEYVADAREAAGRRVALAGYRLADVLRSIFQKP